MSDDNNEVPAQESAAERDGTQPRIGPDEPAGAGHAADTDPDIERAVGLGGVDD